MAKIKIVIKGLNKLIKDLNKFKKSYIRFSTDLLEDFSRKVSLEAQKNMKIRAGYLGKPPWYRNRNTGKYLRIASSKLRDSLRSIYDRSPNSDAVYEWDREASKISVVFGTQAESKSGFSYPYYHEGNNFPFLHVEATESLFERLITKHINKIRFE